MNVWVKQHRIVIGEKKEVVKVSEHFYIFFLTLSCFWLILGYRKTSLVSVNIICCLMNKTTCNLIVRKTFNE